MTNKKNYAEGIYSEINIENLILLGIFLVSRADENCTFERLVAECFTNFPKIFSFKRYPEWPDSLKLDRPLRKLREKGMIVGTVKDLLLLTEFGKQKAIETERILKNLIKPNLTKKTNMGRSTEDRLISYLKGDKLFEDYLNNENSFSITEPEFRGLLRCTLETPLRVLKQNLEYYKKLAVIYNENLLFKFLIKCENRFVKGGNNG